MKSDVSVPNVRVEIRSVMESVFRISTTLLYWLVCLPFISKHQTGGNSSRCAHKALCLRIADSYFFYQSDLTSNLLTKNELSHPNL
jgi:hypothetical protein